MISKLFSNTNNELNPIDLVILALYNNLENIFQTQ
ncbi:MAG: hypothetical protein BWX72_01969 [Firmicutes bacterium ADurb.Bin080]|nr:MAG: hypothetical protein BWX72_01969 [Firmicutes bacterium ADurb.Bin080]